MGATVNIAGWIWTEDAGPYHVDAIQVSGSMPGGYGSASFTVPVGNAYLAPHHSLVEGAWVVVRDNSTHELYEGEIFTIAPSVTKGGANVLAVTCGGLISVAGKRGDLSKTWVHRGSADWVRRPGTPSALGSVNFDNGVIDLRASLGATYDFSSAALNSQLSTVFYLDQGLSDDTISFLDIAGLYDVVAETGYNWTWTLYTSPSLGGTWTASALSSTNNSSSSFAQTLTPPAGTKALLLILCCAAGAHSVAVEKFVTFTRFDIYASGYTVKPRIDQAMVDLAVRTGLATSSIALPVGFQQDDLSIGQGASKESCATGLATLAARHAQPFEYGFWDGKTFIVNPMPSAPTNDARVVLVGGGNPGLVSWDVAESDEDVPSFACVLFGNVDDVTLPEGYPRRLYRPSTPPASADYKLHTVDYTGTILHDTSAAALGDNIVAVASGSIPQGYTFDPAPMLAAGGTSPGNNSDPTSSYQDSYSNAVHGTLTNFGYTTASGWAGSNSPGDPSCIVGDGANDYVDFGDLAALGVGTGAFSVRVWLKVVTAPRTDAVTVISKLSGGQGFALKVTSAMNLLGYVGTDGTHYRQQVGSTTLVPGTWYHVVMTYAGSGGDIALYLSGVAETLTPGGAVGAWNVTNAGSFLMLRGN